MSGVLGAAAANLLATVGASLTLATLSLAFMTWRQSRRNSRVLYGEDDHMSVHEDGLVGLARENRTVLRREGMVVPGGRETDDSDDDGLRWQVTD